MPWSYLIAITTASNHVEVMVAVWNIAGKGKMICVVSNGSLSTDLWIIPKGRRNREEVLAQLQATPAIHSVSVVALSNPVRNEELWGVRELFGQIGWNTSDVTDEMLSLFLNVKLRGEYSYYIDYDPRERAPRKILIKRIEDHPGFSPDWLKATQFTEKEAPDKEYTIDDFKISSVTLKPIKHRTPAPPPPQNNMQQKKGSKDRNSDQF
jgi:hypothetical protein